MLITETRLFGVELIIISLCTVVICGERFVYISLNQIQFLAYAVNVFLSECLIIIDLIAIFHCVIYCVTRFSEWPYCCSIINSQLKFQNLLYAINKDIHTNSYFS